jgi:hypothetical protein
MTDWSIIAFQKPRVKINLKNRSTEKTEDSYRLKPPPPGREQASQGMSPGTIMTSKIKGKTEISLNLANAPQ